MCRILFGRNDRVGMHPAGRPAGTVARQSRGSNAFLRASFEGRQLRVRLVDSGLAHLVQGRAGGYSDHRQQSRRRQDQPSAGRRRRPCADPDPASLNGSSIYRLESQATKMQAMTGANRASGASQ